VAVIALALWTGACGGREEAPGDRATGADEATLPRGDVFGRAAAAVGGVPTVVVMRPIVPDSSAVGAGGTLGEEPAEGGAPTIDQFGLAFSPTLLVVDAGIPITFTNSEGALTHNIHLRSIDRNESVFDEDANSGDAVRVSLSEPGGYDVLCAMHPGMSGFIFVTDAPYTVFADTDGSFSMGRVPQGTYEIRTWTRSAGYGPTDTLWVMGTSMEVDLSGLR
jgi:plastocyanin